MARTSRARALRGRQLVWLAVLLCAVGAAIHSPPVGAEGQARVLASTDKDVYAVGEDVTLYLAVDNPLDLSVNILGRNYPLAFDHYKILGTHEVRQWNGTSLGALAASDKECSGSLGPGVIYYDPLVTLYTPRLFYIPVPPRSKTVIAHMKFRGTCNTAPHPSSTPFAPGEYIIRLIVPDQYVPSGTGMPTSNVLAQQELFVPLKIVERLDGSDGATPETPWKTNATGTLATNIAWNYNMGYQFVPQRNGKVTKLGGFFNGTKTVRLYNASGSVLALADVTAGNGWAYASISPVSVQAGQTYTVAVNLAGNGASYRSGLSPALPQTYGAVQITKSVYRASSELIPTTGSTATMYGQADIEFVPDP